MSNGKRVSVVGRERGEQLAGVTIVEHAVELDVRPVDLGQQAEPLEPALLAVEAALDLVDAGNRDPVEDTPSGAHAALAAVDRTQGLAAVDVNFQSATSTGRPSSSGSGRSRK